MMKSESEAKPMMKSESEAKPMMKSESENHSYPVGSDPGLPYLPLVVTEVATDKEMIILNKLWWQQSKQYIYRWLVKKAKTIYGHISPSKELPDKTVLKSSLFLNL